MPRPWSKATAAPTWWPFWCPTPEWLEAWRKASDKPRDVSRPDTDGDLETTLAGVVRRVNEGLSNIEKVRRFIVTTQPFTIENGLLTPTLKVRRHKIREVYGEALERLYK